MKLVNLFDTCQESGLDITTLLNEQLNDWIEEASEEVSAFRLPEETPWLLRDVLEEKRKKVVKRCLLAGK